MARGPLITPEIEALIASVYKEHPKWKAPQIRNWTISELHRKNANLPPQWPTLSSVQKILATVRRNIDKPSPEDEPWSMGKLNEYPIPSEAIPAVLQVWKFRVAREEGFTIREAKWVTRLSALIKKVDEPWRMDMIKELSDRANGYAYFEFLSEIAGYSTFDSTLLDSLTMCIPVEMAIKAEEKKEKQGMILAPKEWAELWAKAGLIFYYVEPDGSPVYVEASLSVPEKDIEKYSNAFEEIDRQWEDYQKKAQKAQDKRFPGFHRWKSVNRSELKNLRKKYMRKTEGGTR